jgi:uncharacterized membrane protein YqjE
MNHDQAPPESQPGHPATGFGEAPFPGQPANWREAVLGLISSRIALIQIESRDAAGHAIRRLLLVVFGLAALFFTWALLLAGAIGWMARAAGWPWPVLALAAALAHLVAAAILLNRAKRPTPPAFPVTRAEFQKDQSWLANVQKTRKS